MLNTVLGGTGDSEIDPCPEGTWLTGTFIIRVSGKDGNSGIREPQAVGSGGGMIICGEEGFTGGETFGVSVGDKEAFLFQDGGAENKGAGCEGV